MTIRKIKSPLVCVLKNLFVTWDAVILMSVVGTVVSMIARILQQLVVLLIVSPAQIP